ncbi:MAG: hypothetical protein U1E62_11940 [Alsobacter sp.]
MRDKVSRLLEATLYLGVVCWMVWLFFDWKETGSSRSAMELMALALLSWWPLIRTRIRHGFWP